MKEVHSCKQVCDGGTRGEGDATKDGKISTKNTVETHRQLLGYHPELSKLRKER